MANNTNFDTVMNFIRSNPEKHNQNEWVWSEDTGLLIENDCITTACIAGWTAILLGNATKLDIDMCTVGGKRQRIDKVAQRILELTEYESSVLFHCRNAELETVVSDIKQGLYS
jgi:hypothetical protein